MTAAARHETAPARYQAFGLLISSDLALPLPPGGPGAPDLVLRRGSIDDLSDAPLDREDEAIVAAYEHPGGRWYVAVADAGGYRLRFRDCGEFAFAPDLATIHWIAEPGPRARLLPVLFAGTALAFLLTLRGCLVLHASAVRHGEAALAFAGQSGRGKSTLAALTAAAGARVVTDDVLLVDTTPTPPRCRGAAGQVRLREAARSLAGAFGAGIERVETADDRLAIVTRDAESGWVDLAAVAVPRPSREADEVRARRLEPGEALLWLLAFPRVHGLRPAALLQRQFELLGALVRAVPTYDVLVPWGPPFRREIAEELLALASSSR